MQKEMKNSQSEKDKKRLKELETLISDKKRIREKMMKDLKIKNLIQKNMNIAIYEINQQLMILIN